LHATVREQIVGTDQECIDPLLLDAREGCVNLAISASSEDFELPPNGRRRSLCVHANSPIEPVAASYRD
jgi:hypothetical protein